MFSSTLRATVAVVKHENNRRLFRNVALKKRRKEVGDQMENLKLLAMILFHSQFCFLFSKEIKVNRKKKLDRIAVR